MSIAGYLEYQRREYCKDVQCPVQMLLDSHRPGSSEYKLSREVCTSHCIHTTYEFHQWLIQKGYLIVRPDEPEKSE